MIVAGQRVFVAVRNLGQRFRNQGYQPGEFMEPGQGAILVYDRTTGAPIGRVELPEAPIEHGLAAARGRLFATLKDGRVVCLGQ